MFKPTDKRTLSLSEKTLLCVLVPDALQKFLLSASRNVLFEQPINYAQRPLVQALQLLVAEVSKLIIPHETLFSTTGRLNFPRDFLKFSSAQRG